MPHSRTIFGTPLWSIVLPIAGCAMLLAIWDRPLGWTLLSFVVITLVTAVFAAVHHAEVIALRVGEPFGTLVLALAVTVIEASLIVTLMLAGGEATSALARDTVYATVMIICNGVVGLCLLLGALRHRVLEFRVEGTNPVLSVLAVLAIVVLVLPTFTTTTPGPMLSPSQLIFTGVVSIALYAVFVFVQTVRHREYFLPLVAEGSDEPHVELPPLAAAWTSFSLLMISLVAVVGLAKSLSPNIGAAVESASVPHTVVGIAIAFMVLLPETWAASRAALRNRMQHHERDCDADDRVRHGSGLHGGADVGTGSWRVRQPRPRNHRPLAPQPAGGSSTCGSSRSFSHERQNVAMPHGLRRRIT